MMKDETRTLKDKRQKVAPNTALGSVCMRSWIKKRCFRMRDYLGEEVIWRTRGAWKWLSGGSTLTFQGAKDITQQ